MPGKNYIIELTSEERKLLKRLINTGKVAAYKQRHARILLLADEGREGPGMIDDDVAKAVGCGIATVERVRKQLVTQGLEAALQRPKIDRSAQRLLDGDAEAHLIALACSQPPEGHNRWTLRLLAEKMVTLEIVEHCSKDSVHRTLKKTNLSLG
jgi:transposase